MFNFLLIISLINVYIIICAGNSDLTNNTDAVTERQKKEFVEKVGVSLQNENDEKQSNNTLLKGENGNEDNSTTTTTKIVEESHTTTDLPSTTKNDDTFITKTNETIENITDNGAKQTINTLTGIKNEEKTKQGTISTAVGEEKNTARETNSPQNSSNISNESNDYLSRRNITERDQDQKKLISDVQDKKDDEKQYRYVPVHIYDAENAYFNSYNYHGSKIDDDNQENILRNYPNIVKEIQTRFKSSKVKYTLPGKNSAQDFPIIKQVEEEDNASSIEIQAMKPEIILKKLFEEGVNQESSKEDVSYEKPLKHNLNKIRKIMFKKKLPITKTDESYQNKLTINKQSDTDKFENTNNKQDDNGDTFWTESRDTDSDEDSGNDRDDESEINPQKFTEGFKKFGALLQKLVGPIDDNKNSNIQTDSDDNDGLDTNIYQEVINSLKTHNKKIQNSDIHDMVLRLEKIGQDIEDRSKAKKHQSRFNIINREKSTSESENPALNYFKQDINAAFKIQETSSALNMADKFLGLHANHLKDMVEQNDETLENYDWLRTTIVIQAGIAKLQEIIDYHRLRIKLPPADKRLLKLTLYLYRQAARSLADRDTNSQRSTHLRIAKDQDRKPFNVLKRFFDRKDGIKRRSLEVEDDIENLDWSLHCLKSCLNDLHTAIREIGAITTYKSQHWFQNIKQLYINGGREREYLELFLHLVTAKAIGLLDELSQNMAADDAYLRRNLASLERIGAEFMLAMRICSELMILKD